MLRSNFLSYEGIALKQEIIDPVFGITGSGYIRMDMSWIDASRISSGLYRAKFVMPFNIRPHQAMNARVPIIAAAIAIQF